MKNALSEKCGGDIFLLEFSTLESQCQIREAEFITGPKIKNILIVRLKKDGKKLILKHIDLIQEVFASSRKLWV